MSLALAEKRLVGRLIGPYQREGVEWMLKRETAQNIKGGFLCDEMGLGKTIEVIATMLGNQKRRTLIIAPKSVLTQWRDEVRKFTGRTLRVGVWDGPNRTNHSAALAEMDVVITSYSLLLPKSNEKSTPLHRITWDRLVLDEGHEVRNPKTKSFLSIRALKANIRWIVSGTPIFNSIRDFASLCQILGISQKLVQAQCDNIRQTYVLRRTKQDVSEFNTRLALPPCEFDNVELEMNPEEKQLYDEVYLDAKEKVKALLRQNDQGTTMHILECLLRVRQTMIWPQLYYDGMAVKEDEDPLVFEGSSKKHDTLIELIKSHPKEKSLVFCQFVGEMDQIQLRLSAEKIEVFRIDGSVSKDARENRIEGYKKSKFGAVFIIQIKAGGVGLNLQEATRVYITSPAWNPATELQAIARSHRTGQLNKVYIKKLVYAGNEEIPSIEESIMKLQDTKSQVCAEVLNDPRLGSQLPKSKSKYTIQDLKRLFV
jgi:SNF2 family DNA or RNA helicase